MNILSPKQLGDEKLKFSSLHLLIGTTGHNVSLSSEDNCTYATRGWAFNTKICLKMVSVCAVSATSLYASA